MAVRRLASSAGLIARSQLELAGVVYFCRATLAVTSWQQTTDWRRMSVDIVELPWCVLRKRIDIILWDLLAASYDTIIVTTSLTMPPPWPSVSLPSISTKRWAVIFIWVSGQVSRNLPENFDLHVTSVRCLQLLHHRLQVRPAAEADDGKWSCNFSTKFTASLYLPVKHCWLAAEFI